MGRNLFIHRKETSWRTMPEAFLGLYQHDGMGIDVCISGRTPHGLRNFEFERVYY